MGKKGQTVGATRRPVAELHSQGLPGAEIARRLGISKCEQCGVTDWQAKPLALELHHVNGDGRDNRLENLLLLCPNCYSQTDTWGGRNRGRAAA